MSSKQVNKSVSSNASNNSTIPCINMQAEKQFPIFGLVSTSHSHRFRSISKKKINYAKKKERKIYFYFFKKENGKRFRDKFTNIKQRH
jgi:hypothetical protein